MGSGSEGRSGRTLRATEGSGKERPRGFFTSGDLAPDVSACVVLAAGASVRSGPVPKALLPLPGGGTVLRRIVGTAISGSFSPVIVVLGAHAPALQEELLDLPGARSCVHDGWAQGRTGSFKRGLAEAGAGLGGTLLWPVDHPFVLPSTLDALLRAAASHLSATRSPDPAHWVLPTYEGRRGHPVLLSDTAREEVLGYRDDEPLFRYPRSHPGHVLEVPVEDPGVLENIDTPDALASALSRIQRLGPAGTATPPPRET